LVFFAFLIGSDVGIQHQSSQPRRDIQSQFPGQASAVFPALEMLSGMTLGLTHTYLQWMSHIKPDGHIFFPHDLLCASDAKNTKKKINFNISVSEVME